MNEPIEVLITTPFSEEQLSRLQAVSPRLQITRQEASEPAEISDEKWAKVEILYTNRVLPTPEQAVNLRYIQFHWAGVEHALNSLILQKPGLTAATLSGAAVSQMAEHVVLMILATGHHLPDMLDHQRKASWPSDRWERFSPVEVRNSAVGIIGYGSIGRQIARLLNPFGATILATKRDLRHPEDKGYIPKGMGDPGGDFVHRLYPAQALKSMIKECDFVVVSVPLTPKTYNLVSTDEFEAMKPSAFIIDISRGGVVDHSALIQALKTKTIAGAALDVFPEEPLPAESPLWNLQNVIISPHISGNTRYYNDRAIEMFATNLQRYLDGQPLLNRVELDRGY